VEQLLVAKTIYCHPANLELLKRQFPQPDRCSIAYWEQANRLAPGIFDIKFVVDDKIPRYEKKWVPPKSRFWECEESDRPWAQYIGWGHWENDLEKGPVFYEIDDSMEWLWKPQEMFKQYGCLARMP
jgi:hypothetical protein